MEWCSKLSSSEVDVRCWPLSNKEKGNLIISLKKAQIIQSFIKSLIKLPNDELAEMIKFRVFNTLEILSSD